MNGSKDCLDGCEKSRKIVILDICDGMNIYVERFVIGILDCDGIVQEPSISDKGNQEPLSHTMEAESAESPTSSMAVEQPLADAIFSLVLGRVLDRLDRGGRISLPLRAIGPNRHLGAL